MLNKKGFTLIEILGVFIILIIIFSIIGISYAKLDSKIDYTYYKTLENNIIFSSEEYYSLNKINLKNNEELKININTLIDNNYLIDTTYLEDNCNIDESYVVILKENNKLNNYVCLICNDYISSNNKCFK